MTHVARRRPAHHAVPNRDLDIFADDHLPLIPEGIYDAIGGRAHRPRVIFKTYKLYIPFDVLVVNPEAADGFDRVRLYRHYRVHPAPDERFRVRATSDYWREWVIAAGRRPSRRDRLSPHFFERVLFAVEVHTVTRNGRQHELSPESTYSVISRIIERKAGGASP